VLLLLLLLKGVAVLATVHVAGCAVAINTA
jgi:hypothetical protein